MTRRWVRFETPIMVCVEVDDATEHAEVTQVVLAIEDNDIHLARDHRGHFLVYDEQMERCNDDLDSAAARAISTADDRATWLSGTAGDWDEGPDPLRFPDLYDDGTPQPTTTRNPPTYRTTCASTGNRSPPRRSPAPTATPAARTPHQLAEDCPWRQLHKRGAVDGWLAGRRLTP